MAKKEEGIIKRVRIRLNEIKKHNQIARNLYLKVLMIVQKSKNKYEVRIGQ